MALIYYIDFYDKSDLLKTDIVINYKYYNAATGEVYTVASGSIANQMTLYINEATDFDNVSLSVTSKGFKPINKTFPQIFGTYDNHFASLYLEKSSLPILELAAASALLVIAGQKKKKVSGITVDDVKPFLLIGGGLLAFDTVRKILQDIGFWDSAATKNLNSLSTDPNSFWNPNFWRTINPSGTGWTYAIDITTANEWLNDLQNAFGPFNDDEEQAIGVMKRCRTQANCSFLADIFNRNTGQDLLTYLRGGLWPQDRLSDADVNTITQYISKLPKY